MDGRDSKLNRILTLGEAKLGEMISTLMDSEELVERLQRLSQNRAKIERTFAGLRNLIGLPSHDDLKTLDAVLARSGRKLSDLQAALSRLENNIDALCSASASQVKQALAAAPPAAKPAPRPALATPPVVEQPALQPKPKAARPVTAAPVLKSKGARPRPAKVAPPKPAPAPAAVTPPRLRPAKPSAVVSLTGQPLISKHAGRAKAAKTGSGLKLGAVASTAGLTSIDLRKIKGR